MSPRAARRTAEGALVLIGAALVLAVIAKVAALYWQFSHALVLR